MCISWLGFTAELGYFQEFAVSKDGRGFGAFWARLMVRATTYPVPWECLEDRIGQAGSTAFLADGLHSSTWLT